MEELIEKAKAYIENKGMSQVRFALMVGVGESTMSRWLKGEYPNMETVGAKVKLYLEKEMLREETAVIGQIDFVMTGVAKSVWSVLEYTRLQKTLGVIYGDAGIGKTKTAKEWSKGKNDVVYITASPAFTNPKPFLKLIARELKTIRNGSMDDIFFDVLDKLIGRDMTLIIDEAQHLSIKALEIVRTINDSTGTAIVMIGNEAVYHKMLGRQQAEFAQLFSRIGMRANLTTEMLTIEDVQGIFGVTGEELEYLYQICTSKFGLRGAVYVWINARNNNNITTAGLKGMARQMGILA